MTQSLAQAAVSKRVFPVLDGLRGVAAILVVMGHYGGYLAPIRIGSGHLAVDIFFVMSGFVLAHAYEGRLLGGLGARRFMLVRLVRLYPLFLLGMLIAALIPILGIVSGVSEQWSWATLAAALVPALLMLPRPPLAVTGADLNSHLPNALYPLDTPAWSLFYELAVNLAFALLVRFRHRYFLPLLIGMSAIALVVGISIHGTANAGWKWPEWWIAVLRVSFSFFLGVFFLRAYLNDWLPKLRCPPIVPLAIAAVLIWVDVPREWRAPYDLACIVGMLPLVVWLCACSEPRRGPRLYAVLGLISYPLYITHESYHYPIDRILYHVFHIRGDVLAPWLGIGLVPFFVGMSWLLATTYDGWVRRRLGVLIGVPAPRVP